MSRKQTFSNTIHLRDFIDAITDHSTRENTPNYVEILANINIFEEDGFYSSSIAIEPIRTRIHAYLTQEEHGLYFPDTFFYVDGRFSAALSTDGTLEINDELLHDETWEARQIAEPQSLQKKLRVENLLLEASKVRCGVACEIDMADPLGRRRMGGMHVHLRVRFTDGVSRLARIPRQNFTSFPTHLTDEILLSECAVLKWLELAQIPAPKLHKYALGHGNDVGVPYMLVDELPGTPFDQYSATEEQTKKVYSQIADIQSIIYRHPFDHVGSLTLDSDEIVRVGPITGDRAGFLSQLGPFSDAKAFYVEYAEEHLRLIADGQLWGEYATDAYLMFKHIRELALQGKCNTLEGARDEGPFYLKHTDNKGDHILVDDQFNVTGIIDWSFARTLPEYDTFGPSLLTADLDKLLRGGEGIVRPG